MRLFDKYLVELDNLLSKKDHHFKFTEQTKHLSSSIQKATSTPINERNNEVMVPERIEGRMVCH